MLIESIDDQSPLAVARRLPQGLGFVCLSGSPAHVVDRCLQTDRYSFIGIDPWAHLHSKKGQTWCNGSLETRSIEAILSDWHTQYALAHSATLPPFQGGCVGVWHYDDAGALAELSSHADPASFEGEWFAFDLVISFDHLEQTAYLISTGHPEVDQQARAQRAGQRMRWLKTLIDEPEIPRRPAPQWCLQPSVDEAAYCQQVERAQAAIRAGEIFQVNYTQAFTGSGQVKDTWALFEQLCAQNPAPFSGYFRGQSEVILSTSPERFLKVFQGHASSRPIKGTAPKGAHHSEQAVLSEQLRTCPKQRAENTMIVDLVRNDLSKVCRADSVRVTQYCAVEVFAHVLHLVSEVTGQLKADQTALSAFSALFPAGSITGAPKIQAMKWIQQLELQPRGAYCGALGYMSFTGALDSNVLIRTVIQRSETLMAHAGGAVVLASDPKAEYAECLLKAQRLVKGYHV